MGGCPTSVQRRRKVALPPGYSQLHWMQLCQSGRDLSGLRGAPPRRAIPMEEVCRHNTEEDCWSVLDGKVYNLTPYLKFHPGGVADLMLAAGGDCTDLFNETHAWVNGHSMLDKCFVGLLDPTSVASSDVSPFALDKKDWRAFPLVFKRSESVDVLKLTFELPGKKLLGLQTPGQHLKLRAKIGGQTIERAFTPTSKPSQPGTFDLLVKVYPDGVMSSYLAALPEGSSVEMLGPQGALGYPEPGVVTRGDRPVQRGVTHLVLLAAGSGITPMLQLVRAVLESRTDQAKLTLVDCNRSPAHVMARAQLEPLPNMFPGRVQVHHVLSQAIDVETEAAAAELESVHAGRRLDQALLQELLPAVSPEVAVFHCGPPAFDEDVVAMLRATGFQDDQVYGF